MAGSWNSFLVQFCDGLHVIKIKRGGCFDGSANTWRPTLNLHLSNIFFCNSWHSSNKKKLVSNPSKRVNDLSMLKFAGKNSNVEPLANVTMWSVWLNDRMKPFGHNLKNVGIVVRFNDGNDSRMTCDLELGYNRANKINVANETNDFPPPAAPPYNKHSCFRDNTAVMNSNCFGCGSNATVIFSSIQFWIPIRSWCEPNIGSIRIPSIGRLWIWNRCSIRRFFVGRTKSRFHFFVFNEKHLLRIKFIQTQEVSLICIICSDF